MRTIRVFFSFLGDASVEPKSDVRVIERLDATFAKPAVIEPVSREALMVEDDAHPSSPRACGQFAQRVHSHPQGTIQ